VRRSHSNCVADRCQLIKTSCPQIAPYGVTDFHRLKGNFGAKIRVICNAIHGAPYGRHVWRNLWTFLVSVVGFRQKVLLISVALAGTRIGLALPRRGIPPRFPIAPRPREAPAGPRIGLALPRRGIPPRFPIALCPREAPRGQGKGLRPRARPAACQRHTLCSLARFLLRYEVRFDRR
jgi:hypothetical protein